MILFAVVYAVLALVTFFIGYRGFQSTVGEALFFAILGPGLLGLLVVGIVYSSHLF